VASCAAGEVEERVEFEGRDVVTERLNVQLFEVMHEAVLGAKGCAILPCSANVERAGPTGRAEAGVRVDTRRTRPPWLHWRLQRRLVYLLLLLLLLLLTPPPSFSSPSLHSPPLPPLASSSIPFAPSFPCFPALSDILLASSWPLPTVLGLSTLAAFAVGGLVYFAYSKYKSKE